MLKKSLIIATCITLSLFGLILYVGTLYGQYNPGTGTQYPPKHSGQGGRDFGYYFHEVGTAGTYIQYYGTQSVTGSGTVGRITGTSSALPHVEYNYAGGAPTFNFAGGTLQNEGVDVTVSSDLTGYIAVSGGTGTGNVLTDPTLAGAGTISANVSLSGNITANSLTISPAELGYLDNASSNIQSQITTATGSITNHLHTGADGTTQISHNSITDTGTNSHATIDSHLAATTDPHGTTLTQTTLTLTGNANLPNTTFASQTGIIYKDANRFIHNFNYGNNGTVTTTGYNIFVGENAGNLTMGSTATQTVQASYNIALGRDAFISNTLGYNNVTLGLQSLRYNTTGFENAAVGGLALTNNTTGNENLAIGYSSLRGNVSGAYNIGMGRDAGRYLANGSTANQTGNYSLFLGGLTKAAAAGQTNQTVIGYGATGAGSNSIVIGNDDVVTTVLKGNVGIGTSTPATALHVVGTLTATGFAGININNIDGVAITSPAEGHKFSYLGGVWSNATDTAIVAWSGLTGIPTDNGSVSVSAAAGKIPVAGSDGKLDHGWQKDVIRLTGTTTSPEAGAFGQLYVQSSSSSDGGGDTETVLLLHMDNPGTTAFVDSSNSAHTITAVGNAIGTTSAYFGTGALYCDGTNDYIYATDTASLELGAGDFTIELFTKVLSGSDKVVISKGDFATSRGVSIYWGGNWQVYLSANGSDWESSGSFGQGTMSVWAHVALSRQSGTVRAFVNGIQGGTFTSSAIFDNSSNWEIGRASGYDIHALVDEVRVDKGVSRYNANFIPPTTAYDNTYTQYSAKYADPVNGNIIFEILTPGTITTAASYIYCNATTTVWGLGTNTAITSGTATGYYAGWSNRPIRVSAVDIASTKEIKENLKEMHIKPEQLEAESRAKPLYISDKKPAWIVANEINYTYVGTETGTGTVTYVDTAAMEKDYATAIELEWASDLNQPIYIEAVQVAQEKHFWGLFDKIQPKSWNPVDNLSVLRKGLVVEEVPDEIKGADGQSIDQMAVVTFQTLVLQSLKNDTVLIMEELKKLATTGTFTTSVIDKRLEVMRTAP